MSPRRRRQIMFAAAGVVTLAGASAFVFGPGAAWLVDTAGDGQKVWRLGRLEVEGVSGPHLGALTAARIALRDEQGVWAEAENVQVHWKPLDILLGNVTLDEIDVARLHVLRQPALSAPTPRSGPSFDVSIGALHVPRIDIDEPVANLASAFRLDLALGIEGEAIRLLHVDALRLDAPSDAANIQFEDNGRLVINAEVRGAAGGLFAHLIGADDKTLSLDATAGGSEGNGQGIFVARVGDAHALDASLRWQGAEWSINGSAEIGAVPLIAELASRIGPTARFEAGGAREGRFHARVEASNVTAKLEGDKTDGFSLGGPARLTVATPRLAQLAPEMLVGGGAARAEGTFTMSDELSAIDLQVSANAIEVAGLVTPLAGPVTARFTDSAIDVDADLRAPTRGGDPLLADARLRLGLGYDRQRGRLAIERARVEGPSIYATAAGWSGSGDGEFAGEWRVRRVEALARDMRGEVGGRWRLRSDRQGGWVGAANGAARNLRGEPALAPELLGAAPKLDAAFTIKGDLIHLGHARVDGAKLRAGVTGPIRDGVANLSLEASARGPIDLGGATIDGAADITGSVRGALGHPSISATARLATFEAPGFTLTQPTITVALSPVGARDYRGTVEADGQVSGQPAHAESGIVIAQGGVSFPSLVADVAALHAEGSARFTDAGPTADVALSGRIDNLAPGASGAVHGTAALTPRTVSIEADLQDARIGDLRMRTAQISASGPYDNIAARFALRGALNRAALTLEGAGALRSTRRGTEVSVDGQGSLAGAPLRMTRPAVLTFGRGTMQADLQANVGDGALQVSWSERGRALTGSATMRDAPIAPIAAIWGERASGQMSGTASLNNAGGGLSGVLDLALTDARFAQRSAESVSGHVTANLSRDRLTARIDARSSDGLTAQFEANAPVTTSAAPIRVALAPNREGEASWSVHGPVAGLWAAARLNDQALSGDVDGEGRLRFGAGSLTGQGALRIANGAFEDKISGVKLRAIDAEVQFGPNGAQIERFSAQDPSGGRLTATGGAVDPEHGRIVIALHGLRLVDRPDARAIASGDLAFEWQGLDAKLTGDLRLSEGSVSVAQNAAAGVPVLDVVEINRPGADDEPIQPPTRPARSGATTLEVRINAPGRIFTRGRGLDAEWSLDLRLTGDVARPRLFGEARAIRGDLALSGRPFEIQSGVIAFNGDPLEARIDLLAERETADLTARIRLTGTADDPEIAFESDPSLPEDEILPQVLFGRSVEDLAPIEAAQLAASLASLSGQSSFDLAETARSLSGLDRLDVREDEGGGLLVAGGVYLTRDVYVEVQRTGLGEAATRVEWRLKPHLLLVTSFLPGGDQRASIRWRTERD